MANIKQIKPYQFKAKQVDVLTPEAARYADQVEGRDIMKEYTALRKVAQERLRKLKKAGLTDIEVYTENVNRFPSKKEIGSDSRLLYDAISEVTHFLSRKKSTVGGYRDYEAKALAKFKQHYSTEGLEGLSWRTFGKLMESISKSAKAMANYGNWRGAYRAVISAAKKRGLSIDELNAAVERGALKIGPKGGLYRKTLKQKT